MSAEIQKRKSKKTGMYVCIYAYMYICTYGQVQYVKIEIMD